LFIDVDGVVLPFATPGMTPIETPAMVPAPTTRTWSAGSPVPMRQLWLTNRREDARESLGHLFPADRGPGLRHAGHGWWKIDAALAFLKDNPQISRIVWVDDELAEEDVVLGLPFKDIAQEAFEAAGVQAHLAVPNPDTGITAEDLEEIEFFLGVSPAFAPGPAPAAEELHFPDLEVPAALPEPDWASMEADFPPAAPSLLQEDPFDTPARPRFVPADDPFA
jgi:hypothetical protein